jgi:hypothetical protein
LPHAPQLAGSEPRSTHPPAQSASPALHDAAQTPRSHTGVAPPHAIPQPPQSFGSERSETHAWSQCSCPDRQVHEDSEQISSLGHAVAQVPQCLRSLCVSTHARAHSTSPGLHAAAHAPRSHTGVGPPQATPQAPQLPGSLSRSVQAPPHLTSSGAQGPAASTDPPSSPGSGGKSNVVRPQVVASSAVAAATIENGV